MIWTIFQLANDRFLSPINLGNLMLQITAVGMISVGVTLVLLLGEIDLSVAAVSGLPAASSASSASSRVGRRPRDACGTSRPAPRSGPSTACS